MEKADIYRQVLDGKIILNTAKEYISLGAQNIYEEIVVFPLQIFNMLCMYLKNEISAEKLSEWASFLIMSDVYVCSDWKDQEKPEKYERMWYVLQQLSSPELDGEITQKGVRQHLQTLHEIVS